MPRIFVALPIPPETAGALAGLLPQELSGLKRVGAELLHVTLAFIGSVGEERVPEIATAVEAAASGGRAFDVAIDGLGRFPPSGRPQVLWVGTGAAAAEIERLGELVRAGLARGRVPFDPKPLRAHVTIARVRDDASADEAKAIAAAVAGARAPAGLRFRADAVHVMESTQSPRGPRYSSRARIPLPEGDPAG